MGGVPSHEWDQSALKSYARRLNWTTTFSRFETTNAKPDANEGSSEGCGSPPIASTTRTRRLGGCDATESDGYALLTVRAGCSSLGDSGAVQSPKKRAAPVRKASYGILRNFTCGAMRQSRTAWSNFLACLPFRGLGVDVSHQEMRRYHFEVGTPTDSDSLCPSEDRLATE